MALHLKCGNGHEFYVPDCAPECAAIMGAHLDGCPGADLDALLACPPGSGCCELQHNHGDAARACPEDHAAAGHQCAHPEPADCPVWAGTEAAGSCPGGHHGLGVTGCTVCRPMTITFYDGGNPASIRMVTGA